MTDLRGSLRHLCPHLGEPQLIRSRRRGGLLRRDTRGLEPVLELHLARAV